MKSNIILNMILMDYKKELNIVNECVIPFIERHDVERCFKQYNRTTKLFEVSNLLGGITGIIFILVQSLQIYFLILLFIFLIVYFIFKAQFKKQKGFLLQDIKNYLYYFLIQDDKVLLYRSQSCIGEYLLNEITIKPTIYYADLYIYHIKYLNIEIGDCYVSIEDSLYLKKFTFLGNKVEEDEEEN